jgi:hypothetical protein
VTYDAVFTNKHKVLVPDMVKSYAFLQKYLPSVAEKMVELQTKNQKVEVREEDEPEFSYIASVGEDE